MFEWICKERDEIAGNTKKKKKKDEFNWAKTVNIGEKTKCQYYYQKP